MKKLVLGSLALAAVTLAGPAMAADMPVKAPPPAPIWSWAGFYFGGEVGGAWGRGSDWSSDFNCAIGTLCDTVSPRPSGWVAGGQLGYRWQWGPWVLGLEGTLAATQLISNDPSTCTPGVNTCIGIPGGFDVHYDTRLTSLYSATAQAGYAWGQTLWYVKGGWAGGELRRNAHDFLGPALAATFDAGVTHRAMGYTVGTGLEWLVMKNLSIGIEYDYFHLHAGSFANFANTGTFAPAFLTNWSDVTMNVHQVVVRANVLVDWAVFR